MRRIDELGEVLTEEVLHLGPIQNFALHTVLLTYVVYFGLGLATLGALFLVGVTPEMGLPLFPASESDVVGDILRNPVKMAAMVLLLVTFEEGIKGAGQFLAGFEGLLTVHVLWAVAHVRFLQIAFALVAGLVYVKLWRGWRWKTALALHIVHNAVVFGIAFTLVYLAA